MRFTLPRDMYYGKGALEELKNLKGKKAVLVLGGGSMKRFGFVDKVLAYLGEAGIETKLFENVEPDPSVETVMKGAAVMSEFNPDWIVAIGGGSPIDAAKDIVIVFVCPPPLFSATVAIAVGVVTAAKVDIGIKYVTAIANTKITDINFLNFFVFCILFPPL